MLEVSQHRAIELYKMMLFLHKTNKYTMYHETYLDGMCEIYRLRDIKGVMIGEVELRFNQYFYRGD